MIELPEAVTLSRQITAHLRGKRVASCVRGNAVHKFAFYTASPEEYASVLPGKTVGDAWDFGSCVHIALNPGWLIELGGGGERIHLHPAGGARPAKHQLLVELDDGSALSVTVQGWGSCKLLACADIDGLHPPPARRVSPLTTEFTEDWFAAVLDDTSQGQSRNVKACLISKPGVWGVGNGCLQDILWRAGVNHRRRVSDLTGDDRGRLYAAVRETVALATEHGGRDTESDLFGQPGGYVAVLDRRTKGTPCTRCGAAIRSEAFMGGTCYWCPACQP